MLNHSGGKDVLDVYEYFILNATDKANLSLVLKKFDDFFITVTNLTVWEISYAFFTRMQPESESFEQYMASLKI